jgi:hypothetical protein
MRCQFHQILSRSLKPTIESAIVGLVVGTFTFARILHRVPVHLQDDLGPVARAFNQELEEVREALQRLQRSSNPKIMKIGSSLLYGPWASVLSVLGDLIVAFTELEPLIGPLALTTNVGTHGLTKWKARWGFVSKLMFRIRKDKQILLEIVNVVKGYGSMNINRNNEDTNLKQRFRNHRFLRKRRAC